MTRHEEGIEGEEEETLRDASLCTRQDDGQQDREQLSAGKLFSFFPATTFTVLLFFCSCRSVLLVFHSPVPPSPVATLRRDEETRRLYLHTRAWRGTNVPCCTLSICRVRRHTARRLAFSFSVSVSETASHARHPNMKTLLHRPHSCLLGLVRLPMRAANQMPDIILLVRFLLFPSSPRPSHKRL